MFVIGAAAIALSIPATASADVNCAGAVNPSTEQPNKKTTAEYTFMCDQTVLAYSVGFNRKLALFDPEVLPLKPDGTASGELASCEGVLPGPGFGCTFQSASCPGATSTSTECTGVMGIGNTVTSEIEMNKPICSKKRTAGGPLNAWLTVTTTQKNANGKTFVNTSAPFHLDRGIKCPKPAKNHQS